MKNSKKKITDFPSIEITLRAYNTLDQGDGEGGRVVFHTFPTEITLGNRHIGFVGGGMGHVVISITDGPHFLIPHDELWYAIQDALKKDGLNG